MVEVCGLVHQLDVGEAEEKGDNGKSVFKTNRNCKCREAANYKQNVGPLTKRLYPLKAIIRKEKCGVDIKFFDPAVAPESNDADEHHYSEENTKGCQWCSLRLSI